MLTACGGTLRAAAPDLAQSVSGPNMQCPPAATVAPGPDPYPADTEKDDTDGQSSIQDDELVDRYQATQPETAAGTWLDNDVRSQRAAFVGDLAPHAEGLRKAGADMNTVQLCSARFTTRELDALMERVGEDSDELLGDGIDVKLIDNREELNRVEIGVLELNDETVRALESRYRADRITVVQGDTVPETETVLVLPRKS